METWRKLAVLRAKKKENKNKKKKKKMKTSGRSWFQNGRPRGETR